MNKPTFLNKYEVKRYEDVVRSYKMLGKQTPKHLNQIQQLINILQQLRTTASKNTHYDKLNEYSDQVYEFIHARLKEYNFKNGEPEINKLNVEATFWWQLYNLFSNVTYSPFLQTKVANHHSSAWERNEAFIKDLEYILQQPNPFNV